MKLSQTLSKICTERKLNLSKLAKETGVPIQTIHGWTEGRKAVNLAHLRKVAEYLKIPIFELLYGERDSFELSSEEILRELFSGDIRVTVHKIEKRRD